MQEVRWNILDEIMLYDMYLRENVKGRPVWAKDTAKYKKEWKMLYREQEKNFSQKKYRQVHMIQKSSESESY